MRWNLKNILLFSHDGRRRDLAFGPGVNIITGNSNTGKSALSEIINYVMGSGRCYIPLMVRNSSSWFGLVWVRGDTQFLICRRSPKFGRSASPEMFVEIGQDIELPSAGEQIAPNRTIDSALRMFEDLLGIEDIKVEAHTAGRLERITFRHVLPFMLQDDGTIINKERLLWISGEDDRDEKRKAQVARMPYFLGVVGAETVAAEAELESLRRQLRFAELRSRETERLLGEDRGQGQLLLIEAAGVGLIEPPQGQLSSGEINSLLRQITAWQPLETDEAASNTQVILADLYREKEKLEARLQGARSHVRAAERALALSSQFRSGSAAQAARLEVVSLLPHGEKENTCPTCSQTLEGLTPSVDQVRQVYERLQSEIGSVERQQPRLSEHITASRNHVEDIRSRLLEVTNSIARLVKEQEEAQAFFQLDQRRMRVLGRISLYLDTVDERDEQDLGDGTVDDLKEKIIQLEDSLNPAAKREVLEQRRNLVNADATRILDTLPFEQRYRSHSVDFNPRDLSIGLLTPEGRVGMRAIGSDENYLSLHLALLLSLHRFFAQARRPVPGVLLIDQLSRPYFPTDLEEEVEVPGSDDEVGKLQTYFDALFAEHERDTSMQFIVLEHAYLRDDKRFMSAVRERWVEGNEYLVPDDWPEA